MWIELLGSGRPSCCYRSAHHTLQQLVTQRPFQAEGDGTLAIQFLAVQTTKI